MTTRFLTHLALWAAALLALQVLLGGGSDTGRLAHMGFWATFALTLAAYPAGIAVARNVFAAPHPNLRDVLRFVLLSAGLGLGMLVLVGWLVPALSNALEAGNEADTMTLGALYERAHQEVERADAQGPSADASTWQDANHWAWAFLVRLGTPPLAVLLVWIGLFVGYWSGRTSRVELRRLQQWVIGFCLVVTTYFAGENTYELVLLQASGPVFFLAWLRLLAPALLACGLGWTTLVQFWPLLGGPLLGGHRQDPVPE